MALIKNKSGNVIESDHPTSNNVYQIWFNNSYNHHPEHPSPKNKTPLIMTVIVIIFIAYLVFFISIFLIGGGKFGPFFEPRRLESFYFEFDSEAEVDEALLNELYSVLGNKT